MNKKYLDIIIPSLMAALIAAAVCLYADVQVLKVEIVELKAGNDRMDAKLDAIYTNLTFKKLAKK